MCAHTHTHIKMVYLAVQKGLVVLLVLGNQILHLCLVNLVAHLILLGLVPPLLPVVLSLLLDQEVHHVLAVHQVLYFLVRRCCQGCLRSPLNPAHLANQSVPAPQAPQQSLGDQQIQESQAVLAFHLVLEILLYLSHHLALK